MERKELEKLVRKNQALIRGYMLQIGWEFSGIAEATNRRVDEILSALTRGAR
jgi:hypothetical protein